MSLLGLIVAGAIIGLLARFLMKGDAGMGMIATTILGVLGVLAGYYLAGALGVAQTNGVDWLRWGLSILCSILFISAYLAFDRRNAGPRM